MKFSNREVWFVIICIIWILVAWLISPVMQLDKMEWNQVKWFIYRIGMGISIMIILFGKTIFDLLFTPYPSQKKSLFNTIMLSLYAFGIGVGIILMVVRMIGFYIQANPPETPDMIL